MLIDTHAHYDDAAFDEDREVVLAELKSNHIIAVNVGASMQSTLAAVAVSENHENIYAAVGVHPEEVGALTEDDMTLLAELSRKEKVLAIGEIGLEYHYDEVDRETQKRWFIRQLDVARQMHLPVCIHSREAAQDTEEILRKEQAAQIGGVLHCYSYELPQAKEYAKDGWFFGIGGVVTFKNARKLTEVVEYLPLEQIVLETDCPYLAPTPYRGSRNSSLYLPLVAAKIGEIKGKDPEEIIEITAANAQQLYPKMQPTR